MDKSYVNMCILFHEQAEIRGRGRDSKCEGEATQMLVSGIDNGRRAHTSIQLACLSSTQRWDWFYQAT